MRSILHVLQMCSRKAGFHFVRCFGCKVQNERMESGHNME